MTKKDMSFEGRVFLQKEGNETGRFEVTSYLPREEGDKLTLDLDFTLQLHDGRQTAEFFYHIYEGDEEEIKKEYEEIMHALNNIAGIVENARSRFIEVFGEASRRRIERMNNDD